MSKILKVVDGKHYVEGGPACEWRRGISQRFCVGGKITYPGIKWRPCPGPDYISDEDCPACDGTGLQPVEQWSDARKAATLQEWGYYGFEYFRAADQGVNVARTENKIGEPIHGEGKDLTEALTNLVIAVAEEEKCDD